jgi:BirA family biotin operon repressor/biotin-[acetyl-CoA-carboxylase] ligase
MAPSPEPPTPLDTASIQALLTTTTLGRTMQVVTQTASTNDDVKALVVQGAPEGTVVLAEEQLHGRGRLGRSFASPRGIGIYLSLLLRPHLDVSRLPQITLLVGVAAAEAITELCHLPAQLKWPNDVEVHGKKVAGILTEAVLNPDQSFAVVVGIGINVNTTLAELPSELHQHVTSLALEAGHPFARPPLIAAFLGHLERLYKTLQEDGMASILTQWLHYGPIIGRRIRFTHEDIRLEATVENLAEDGALLVRLDDGSPHRVIAGEVVLL